MRISAVAVLIVGVGVLLILIGWHGSYRDLWTFAFGNGLANPHTPLSEPAPHPPVSSAASTTAQAQAAAALAARSGSLPPAI